MRSSHIPKSARKNIKAASRTIEKSEFPTKKRAKEIAGKTKESMKKHHRMKVEKHSKKEKHSEDYKHMMKHAR